MELEKDEHTKISEPQYMDHLARLWLPHGAQPKLSSKDHNVNPTGLAVLPNIMNVTDRIEKQKCHDDFQTKRNKIQQHLRLANVSREPLTGAGVYHIPWPCRKVYVDATNTLEVAFSDTWINWHMRLQGEHPESVWKYCILP
ncbi:hypothetical protein C0J52_03020 [Blattella germanica]|nr:hypothetical protein C0J52_03020 [Blattella germanica]